MWRWGPFLLSASLHHHSQRPLIIITAPLVHRTTNDAMNPPPQSKMSKVDAIMSQREALVREVQRVQSCMAGQEDRMRSALDTMQVGGRALCGGLL